MLGPAIIFCLSFTLMFVALGMTATGLGSTLRDSKETLDTVAGILIVAMGVFFLLTPFVPRLNQEWRPDALIRRAGAGGPIIAGPRLRGGVDAVRRADAGLDPRRRLDRRTPSRHGGVLLAFYSLGLAVPFLLTALAFDRATTAFGWIREHYMLVTAISGCVLIVDGHADPHRRAHAAQRPGPEGR